MSIQFSTLHESHLEDAARLVCARYAALLQQTPMMPPRYTDISAILPRLQDLFQQGAGIAALHSGKLVGFLHGFVLPDFLGKRSLYSPEWANAAALDDGARIYGEMYARLSATWAADGCFQHVLTLLANDAAGLDAWRWLGFGMAAVDAVRDLSPLLPPPARVDIRRATLADQPVASRFAEALARHVSSPPVFWPHEPDDMQTWLSDPRHYLFLASVQGEILGTMGLEPDYKACLVIQDEKTIAISSAFTLEQARCQGIAAGLLSHALDWARLQGYARCTVDFEAANLQAHRFWLTYFQPVCYSLLRCVHETI